MRAPPGGGDGGGDADDGDGGIGGSCMVVLKVFAGVTLVLVEIEVGEAVMMCRKSRERSALPGCLSLTEQARRQTDHHRGRVPVY